MTLTSDPIIFLVWNKKQAKKGKVGKLIFFNIKNFLYIKGRYQSEKALSRMGVNICKSSIWYGIDI